MMQENEGQMQENEGQRILEMARERGLTLEAMHTSTRINAGRMKRLLYHGAVLEDRERASFARVLGVYRIEIKYALAERLGRFLRAENEVWRLPKLFGRILETGLRGEASEETERRFFQELLLEDRRGDFWDPDNAPPYW
jgi:hypothetical protein